MKILKRMILVASITFLYVVHIGATTNLKEPTPGVITIKNLLNTALCPVGHTVYIWGGGWGSETSGNGGSSTHIGLLPFWEEFFNKQNSSYNYKTHCLIRSNTDILYTDKRKAKYGLDCSGFVGWSIYNVMNTKDNEESFVCKAKDMAKVLAFKHGFGAYKDYGKVKDVKPGDIMSIGNKKRTSHVYISLGACSDGSQVIVDSASFGVQLRGTENLSGNTHSEAIKLAETYMKRYYPDWCRKFPNNFHSKTDYKKGSQMRWDTSKAGVMKDPDGYREFTPGEILKDLFCEE